MLLLEFEFAWYLCERPCVASICLSSCSEQESELNALRSSLTESSGMLAALEDELRKCVLSFLNFCISRHPFCY